jgi:hypothetical protein
MTTTISRLYDDYSDAEQAVTRLESAGYRIPISASSPTIPIIGTGHSAAKSIVTATALMIAPREPARAPVLALASVGRQAFSPGSAYWPFPVSGRSWLRDGSPPRPLVQPRAQPQAALLARSLRRASPERTHRATRRAFAAVARSSPRRCPTMIVHASMRFSTRSPSTFRSAVPLGRRPAGATSTPQARRCLRRTLAASASFTAWVRGDRPLRINRKGPALWGLFELTPQLATVNWGWMMSPSGPTLASCAQFPGRPPCETGPLRTELGRVYTCRSGA